MPVYVVSLRPYAEEEMGIARVPLVMSSRSDMYNYLLDSALRVLRFDGRLSGEAERVIAFEQEEGEAVIQAVPLIQLDFENADHQLLLFLCEFLTMLLVQRQQSALAAIPFRLTLSGWDSDRLYISQVSRSFVQKLLETKTFILEVK